MLASRKHRKEAPMDSYHETTTKDLTCWSKVSRSCCLRAGRFVLVPLLAAAHIASARARTMTVGYRS